MRDRCPVAQAGEVFLARLGKGFRRDAHWLCFPVCLFNAPPQRGRLEKPPAGAYACFPS